MEEQKILFETAKLANEKGFKEKTSKGYVIPPEFYGEKTGQLTNSGSGYHKDMIGLIAAPTQSLLQKWLREKHEIFIDISTGCKDEFGVIVGPEHNPEWIRENNGEGEAIFYNTYELALEAGLIEALKLVK